jgi:hypothetical protein
MAAATTTSPAAKPAAGGSPAAATKPSPTASRYPSSLSFTGMIRADHDAIRALMDDLDEQLEAARVAFPAAGAAAGEGDGVGAGKALQRVLEIARALIGEVSAHASCEERLLYPQVKTRLVDACGPELASKTPLRAGGGLSGGNGSSGKEAEHATAGAGASADPHAHHHKKPTAAQQRDAESLYERMLMDDQTNKELLQWCDCRVPGTVACAAEGCTKPAGAPVSGSGERGVAGHDAAGGIGDVERALLVSTLGKFACVEREHMETEEALLLAPLEALLTSESRRSWRLSGAWPRGTHRCTLTRSDQ